jgi:hypothetical protein
MLEIRLTQTPIIEHDLFRVGRSVTERLNALNLEGQVATEETVGALKKLRAELNKEAAEYEAQRKAVKDAVMKPYTELEDVYKPEVSDKYKAADALLKEKIAFVENEMKSKKRDEVVSYFDELCMAENLDFLSFSQTGIEVKLSDSLKSLKDKVFEFIGKVSEEIRLIDTQDYKAEILVEYKKTLNAAKAIREIKERKEAEKYEQERIKLAETQRRQRLIGTLSMVYHDLTKTYNWVKDETVYITNNDIETLPEDAFQIRYVQLQEEIKSKTTIGDFVEKNITAPLKAPIVETPDVKEELFTAVFECELTKKQAELLREFLITNNITYKNIEYGTQNNG